MLSLPRVAYFCMEYGLDPSLTIYSGGLGILAGDHMKSVGDLKVPLVGIGLLWDEGYTRQILTPGDTLEDQYPKTLRDALTQLDVQIEVTVRGKAIPCTAWKVNRFLSSTLYLLEPVRESDKWITQRLYGGDEEDRLAQEIVLGVGGVRLLRALGHDVDVYHFNEGHAVFAGLELLRENRFGGNTLADRMLNLRPHVVFTTHTPVPAGNEIHSLEVIRRMNADVGFTDAELTHIGGAPFSMTVAGLRLSRMANGVAELHGQTARSMWKDVAGAAPIISITNGVHAATWQDARIRAALASGKAPAVQADALWTAHQRMKQELSAEIRSRTGVGIYDDGFLIGFARRAASYKRADLILSDDAALQSLFEKHRVQIVYSGKAHPRDTGGKAIVGRLVEMSRYHPGKIIFLENYDMRLGAMLTRGCDIWLNNPRRPLEASGTSGMKAAMNGVPNVSILDGWWPEGSRHGETGWNIGDANPSDDAFSESAAANIDARDREILHRVLRQEVLPAFAERQRWVAIMRASIEMSQWQFSSDRMVEDYVAKVYSAG
jgi:glycogen phosphorylase